MIKYILIIFLVFLTMNAIASSSLNYTIQAPPKSIEDKSLYYYLNTLYSRWNTLQVTEQQPNVNIEGNYGNIIVYKNGATFYLAVETTSPSGTTWQGIALGAI